jgi:hypothetical protein
MINARKIAPIVNQAIARADKSIIAETFYDEVSNRVFVKLIKGQRKTEIVLPARYFDNGDATELDRSVKKALERLRHTPIG